MLKASFDWHKAFLQGGNNAMVSTIGGKDSSKDFIDSTLVGWITGITLLVDRNSMAVFPISWDFR